LIDRLFDFTNFHLYETGLLDAHSTALVTSIRGFMSLVMIVSLDLTFAGSWSLWQVGL